MKVYNQCKQLLQFQKEFVPCGRKVRTNNNNLVNIMEGLLKEEIIYALSSHVVKVMIIKLRNSNICTYFGTIINVYWEESKPGEVQH